MLDLKLYKPKILLALISILVLIIFCGILIAMIDVLATPKSENGFKLVCQTKTSTGDIPIYKFESLKTGLHVIIAKVEGPVVQGFFTIVTETHDDDGLPHTLEHLIFLGSEDYPYKGVLDLFANLCLAEGTNAWTDIDHTAYTVGTAGSDGFLNLLPIYLDHLLYPTLTDTGFTTEVYHITGEGKDAGVVYSEMQARENTGPELTFNKLVRALYPEPSGYHYETGGMMANLRESTTNEKIRNYHKAMYRPENLHVIITGQVEPNEVFHALKLIEDKIVSKDEHDPFVRPWETPIPTFTESRDFEVVYPSDTEDTGIVRVGWRGPSFITNITEVQSMEVLMKYLTETSVSPLPKTFIEVDDPFASYVEEYVLGHSISSCIISFYGVPENKINGVKPLLTDTLDKIVNSVIPFDLEVMRNTLNNLIQKEESYLETSPHDTFSHYIIQDVLYGHSCEYLDKVINKKSWYEHLLTEPSSFWLKLIEKYLISPPSAVVRGVPSTSEANRLQEEEKKRIEKRKSELGEAGLKQMENKVAEAERINEIPPPSSMLDSVSIPSTDKINFHSLKVYTNIENHNSEIIPKSDPSLFDMDVVPVKMQLDDIKSNFVEIVAILDTHSLSPSERLYLPLLLDLLLESPILKEGAEVPYEVVVKNLNADTLNAKTINGLSLTTTTFIFGNYFHNVGLNFKVELMKYEKGIGWLGDILFRVILNSERVAVKASKLLNSIGDKKREGSTMLKFMVNDVVFKGDTNVNKANALRQEKFLNQVIATLKTDPNKIIEDLNNVYKNITHLDNITIHMATKLEKLASLTNATRPWVNFAPNELKSANMNLKVISDWEERVSFNENQSVTGFIAGIGSVESACLQQTTPAMTSYSHTDLPALMTAISYLIQMEGPLWKQIRGKGLAYNYLINIKPSEGTLTLKLTKAAHLTGAFKEARSIINSYLNKTKPWDRLLFESARSSLIYEIIEREAEISDVVQQSLYAYYRKVPHDYNRALLRAVDEVKLEDLDTVADKYFKPLIDPKLSRTVVVCPSSKVTEFQTEFTNMGHVMEVIDSLEDSRFSQL